MRIHHEEMNRMVTRTHHDGGVTPAVVTWNKRTRRNIRQRESNTAARGIWEGRGIVLLHIMALAFFQLYVGSVTAAVDSRLTYFDVLGPHPEEKNESETELSNPAATTTNVVVVEGNYNEEGTESPSTTTTETTTTTTTTTTVVTTTTVTTNGAPQSAAPILPDGNITNITTIDDLNTGTVVLDDDSNNTINSSLQFPPPSGFGYPLGTAFQFRYIYIIGKQCNTPDDWFTRWSAAGVAALGEQKITKVICSDVPWANMPSLREWWLESFEEIANAVGEEHLNQTLVITVALGLETDWGPVAEYLRKGMAFFHAKEDPHDFDISEFGLSAQDVLYFYFQWDEISTSENIGKELCRLYKGAEQLKIAKIYTAGRDGSLNFRVDLALKLLKEECPNIEIVELWTVESDIELQELQALLQFNRVPDICLTAQDEVARDFIESARMVLDKDTFRQVAATGWNYIQLELLEERKLLVTVDQQVLYPDRGLWQRISSVVQAIEDKGLNSTKAVQDALRLGPSLVIQADTLMVSSDSMGFLLSTLLKGYDPEAPPSRSLQVSTGLYDVTITDMDPFKGLFQAVLWLRISWKDTRLTWEPTIYDGEIPVDLELIWYPSLFFKNKFDNEDLYQGPAILTADGTVVISTNMQAVFLCSTSHDLRGFPFDGYDCSIDLAAPTGIVLDSNFMFEVIECDPNYDYSSSIAEDHGSENVIYYKVRFDRKHFTGWVRMIIPGLLINLVGFMAFWIPAAEESIALGVTSLLCAITFRETVDIPETSGVTWAEVFMMITIAYQAAVMFIIWVSYSQNKFLARSLERIILYFHPQKMASGLAKSTRTFQFSLQSEGAITYNKYGAPSSDYPVITAYTNSTISSNDVPIVQAKSIHRPSVMVSDQEMQTVSEHAMRALQVLYEADSEDDTSTRSDGSGGSFAGDNYNMNGSGRELNGISGSSRGLNRTGSGVSTRGLNKKNVSFRIASSVGADTNRTSRRPSVSAESNTTSQKSVLLGRPSFVKQYTVGGSFFNSSDDNNNNNREQDDENLSSESWMKPQNDHEKLFLVNPQDKSTKPTQNPSENKGKAPGRDNNGHDKNDDESDMDEPHNVDWIGRWIIVPSYFIVMVTLLTTGWGYQS